MGIWGRRVFAALFCVFLLRGTGLRAVETLPLKREKVPEVVRTNFDLAHPHAKRVRWGVWEGIYYARTGWGAGKVFSFFQSNGEWICTRWQVEEGQIPLRSYQFLQAEYPACTVVVCHYEEDRWNGRHYYVLLEEKGVADSRREICFDLTGEKVDFPQEGIRFGEIVN